MASINNPKKISKYGIDPFKEMFSPITYKAEPMSFDFETPHLSPAPKDDLVWVSAIQWYHNPDPKPIRYQYDSVTDKFLVKKEALEVSPKVVIAPLCFACKHPVCEVHGECEENGCILIGKCITSKQGMLDIGLVQARTQKVKGFIQLYHKFGLRMPIPYSIVMEDDDIQYAKEIDAYIRPCPVRPRHGFVESNRMVSTQDNIRKVWEACKAADSEGELIICKAIDAKYNAIITPSMLAVGPGNAGATGGKDSVSIPLMGVLPPEIKDTTKLFAVGVDINIHDPYLELVRDNNETWFYTQLRAGAKVPKAPDYVPELIRVDRTLEASGDLMEWEKQVGTITQGTVVYHIGGTLISHYGVHCLTNHIPIFTTRVPTVGEVLEPIGEVVQHEPQQMIRGLALGAMVPMDQQKIGIKFTAAELLPLMMTILHNSPAMGNGWGVWVGFAASIMIRCGMAASHGEARHADPSIKRKFTRNTIYSAAFQDFFGSRETLGKAQSSFLYYKWGGGAYGGKKWASCTESIILLDRAARDLMRRPSEVHRVGVVNALNRAVNEAHNGGWWLNKFITEDRFSQASEQSLMALEKVAEVLVPVNKYFNSIPAEAWKSVAFKWANAGEIVVPIPGVIKSIDQDGDIDDDEPDEPTNPYMDEYDKSLGYDPNCCNDCWDKYHYNNLKAKQDSPVKVLPVPEKQTTTTTTISTGKAKKIPFSSSMIISEAHVRLEWSGSHYNAHIQCKDGNYYASFDVNIDKEISIKAMPKLSGCAVDEISYSSGSKGYLPMKVNKVSSAIWVFTEPITELVFGVGTDGNIAVGLV